MKALKYTAIVFSLLAAFGANAQSQSTNDDDDENLNILQTTESEYINLSGQVLTYCYLWVDVKAAAATLNVKGGNNNVTVASIQETCNNPSGFTVAISSANNGNLMNGTNAVAYTIDYDGTAEALTTTKIRTRTGTRFDDATNTGRDFGVTLAASPSAVAGTYSDTITITIASSS